MKFTVYKITNKTNGKAYIGSSVNIDRRWREHINISKNPNSKHYNYPLYQAFRKYGLENFTFEILKEGFETAQDMQKYEQEMIIHYNTLKHGYNQTLYTDNALQDPTVREKFIEERGQKCAEVDLNNNILQVFNSYHEAGRIILGRENCGQSIRLVCKGKVAACKGHYFRDLDKNGQVIYLPFKAYKHKKAIIGISPFEEGETLYFYSVSECAKQLNTDRGSISKCIQGNTKYSVVKGYILRELDLNGEIVENNISIDEKIKEYNNKYILIKGQRKTKTEWAKEYGISKTTLYKRLNKGMTIFEALGIKEGE